MIVAWSKSSFGGGGAALSRSERVPVAKPKA